MKILEGFQPCRINFGEPTYPAELVEAPAWLEGLAWEHWHELAPLLARARVMTDGDRAALAALCEDYRRWRTDPDDDKAKDRYRRMLVEFGLTPSARSRIVVAPEKPKDELGAFLGKKKA